MESIAHKVADRIKTKCGNHYGGGSFNLQDFYSKHKEDIDNLVNHVKGVAHNVGHMGKNLVSGGSYQIGGSIGAGSISAGSIGTTLREPQALRPITDHKEMYHSILKLKPVDWEAIRESATQILGGKPSPMWNHLKVDTTIPLKSDPKNYEHVMRMPNTHSAARMIEAEHSVNRGAGFFDALKHSIEAAAPVLTKGAKFLAENKGTIANFVPYGNQMMGAIDIGSKIVSIIQKIADSIKNLEPGADSSDIMNAIKDAVIEVVGEEYPSIKGMVEAVLGGKSKKGRHA